MLFGYARCSTDEQANGTTLEEQARAINGYAMMKGVSAFDLQVFTDAGISGAMALCMRPAGYDLLQAAQPNDTIVATKLDRVFRDSLDALKCYVDFKERGINLVLLDFGVEPVTNDNSIGKILYTMMAAFADWERSRIAVRMKEGKEAKRRNGGHAGGEAPYGYKVVGSKRHAKLEIEPREQEMIAVIESMRKKPPLEIAHTLNAQGMMTRSGKPWYSHQVVRVLEKLPNEQAAIN